MTHVADADWRPIAPKPSPSGTGGLWTPDADLERLYDTIIEVIDLRSGKLILSNRFPQRLLGFVFGQMASSYEEDAKGNPRYVIWSLRVHTN
jgi:hypothetical protein